MYALGNSQLIHPYQKKKKQFQLIPTSHPFANINK